MAPIKPEISRMSDRKWKKNKAYCNMNIDYWTQEFVLFLIIRILGSILQIIVERPSPIVDIF